MTVYKYHNNHTKRSQVKSGIILLPDPRKIPARDSSISRSCFGFDLFYFAFSFCNATKTANIFSYLLNIYIIRYCEGPGEQPGMTLVLPLTHEHMNMHCIIKPYTPWLAS